MNLSPYLAHELRAKDQSIVVGHIGLLMNLDRGSANLSELANLQGVTLPTMSNMVSTLVERGWIRREPSESDRRMVVLQVTAEGHTVLRRVRRQVADSIQEMLDPISEGDLDTLCNALALLERALPRGADTSAAD